jgi:hypothetical protein
MTEGLIIVVRKSGLIVTLCFVSCDLSIYSRNKTRYHAANLHSVAQLVEALTYQPEGRGFDYGWWIL